MINSQSCTSQPSLLLKYLTCHFGNGHDTQVAGLDNLHPSSTASSLPLCCPILLIFKTNSQLNVSSLRTDGGRYYPHLQDWLKHTRQ